MEEVLLFILYGGVTVIIAYLVYMLLFQKGDNNLQQQDDTKKESKETDLKESKAKKATAQNGPSGKRKKTTSESGSGKIKDDFKHSWLIATLKGHSSLVTSLDLSLNRKYLASAGDDRTVLIWMTKDFQKDHRQIRVNIEFDSANNVRWSPDNKAFVISKENEKTLEVFKLGKKPDGTIGNIQSAFKFPQVHNDQIIGLGIAVNGKFILSSSSNGQLILWDFKGRVLTEMNTSLKTTYCAKISKCGRYFAFSGASPTVTSYKVEFDPTGEFKDLIKSFELKGHTSDVFSFEFNIDSSKIATISKDGQWRLFDTTGSRVNIVKSGDYIYQTNEEDINPVITMTQNATVIAIGVNTSVTLFSGLDGCLLTTIDSVFNSPIIDLIFSDDSKYLFSSGDRYIRVFHNICGYEEIIKDLKSQMKDSSISTALRKRLAEELQTNENNLKSLTTSTEKN